MPQPHVEGCENTSAATDGGIPAAAPQPPSKDRGFDAEVLRNQLLLLGLLVFFVGTVSTEAYYSSFGVKYQLLGLPTFHFMYRGFATLVGAWYLLLLYLSAVVWILLLDLVVTRQGRSLALLLAYAALAVLIALAYPLGRLAGLNQARADMTTEDSQLPVIECAKFSGDTSCGNKFRRYRVLISFGGELLVFEPISRAETASYPIIIHIPQGDLHELRTSASH